VIFGMPQYQEWKDFKYSIEGYLKKKKIPNLLSMVKQRIPGKEIIWILAPLAVTGLVVFMVIWFFVAPNF